MGVQGRPVLCGACPAAGWGWDCEGRRSVTAQSDPCPPQHICLSSRLSKLQVLAAVTQGRGAPCHGGFLEAQQQCPAVAPTATVTGTGDSWRAAQQQAWGCAEKESL